ncbi:hypothetical protein FGO68_gene7478 [Halteria grandinella]|uniref:Uncharacterized protein n=1 Tax=Halteria grandinella TaxID=5974 RepID=A0A8J8P1D9_HALGN|nr:hypothetical protein FGO68_gene7478 [Halteria grandinella]
MDKKVIIDSLNMVNSTGKVFLQAVNFPDRVFLIQREHTVPKCQKITVYEFSRETGQLMHIFDKPDAKKAKPVCFGHQNRLFIILPGAFSIAYDYKNYQKLEFAVLTYNISNTNDLKPVILNDRELFILQSSKWSKKPKSQGEIWTIDLQSLVKWSTIDIKTDTRPKDLLQFGVLPYRKPGDGRMIIMIFGGSYNTLRQCFLMDDLRRDVSRCSIYTGDFDRMLTNQLYMSENEIIAFGVERMHIFDKRNQKFTARCYDFAYDYDLRNQRFIDYMEIEDDEENDLELPKKRRKSEPADEEHKKRDSSLQEDEDSEQNNIDNPEEAPSQFDVDMSDTQMALRNELFMHSLPTTQDPNFTQNQNANRYVQQQQEEVDMTQSNNIDDLVN